MARASVPGHYVRHPASQQRMTDRAAFIVGKCGTWRYVENVPEIASYPHYNAAHAALWQVGSK
jgi:hypothetical protein